MKRLAQLVGLTFVAGILLPGLISQAIAAYKTRGRQSGRTGGP